ncbi:MAG: alpha/beta hydrolase, partial [Planctomycetota bacterium]
VLFCHGNAGNLTHRWESIQFFLKLNMDILIFDYRGYGKSKGSPTEKGTYLDGERAWEYLIQSGYSREDILVFGRSLGGGVATYLAEKYHPKALVLESTFTSLMDRAKELYPFFPVSYLLKVEYPNLKRLKNIQCPILIIHSQDDEVIPYHHGQRLLEAAREPKSFLEIRGGHNDGDHLSQETYLKEWQKLLDTYFPIKKKKSGNP